jgi:hypothetical protein
VAAALSTIARSSILPGITASNPRPVVRTGPRPKARYERPYRYIREDFFLARSFRDLDDLNAQLRPWLETVANPRVHAATQFVVNEAFAVEKPPPGRVAAGIVPLGVQIGTARLP